MKGTRTVNGYNIVDCPGDDRGFSSGNKGYRYEHRVVAEKMLGRKLSDSEVVHHIDGDKRNNTPENLLVLHGDEHTRLHSYIKVNPNLRSKPKSYQERLAKIVYVKDIHETKVCQECGRAYTGSVCPCKLPDRKRGGLPIHLVSDEFVPIDDEFRETIKREVAASSVCSVGRRLGVSDHTVKKIITGQSKSIRKDRILLTEDPNPPTQKAVTEESRKKLSESLKAYWNGRPSPYDKPIVQLDKNGSVVAEFRSARDAERKTGMSNSVINQCCNGKKPSYRGFIWKFK